MKCPKCRGPMDESYGLARGPGIGMIYVCESEACGYFEKHPDPDDSTPEEIEGGPYICDSRSSCGTFAVLDIPPEVQARMEVDRRKAEQLVDEMLCPDNGGESS